MITVTRTQLRSGLFTQIDHALKGTPIHIRTKRGNAVLISEKSFESISPQKNNPKIPGRIVGRLDDADKAMNQHLVLPE